jgi:hypothetical protein
MTHCHIDPHWINQTALVWTGRKLRWHLSKESILSRANQQTKTSQISIMKKMRLWRLSIRRRKNLKLNQSFSKNYNKLSKILACFKEFTILMMKMDYLQGSFHRFQSWLMKSHRRLFSLRRMKISSQGSIMKTRIRAMKLFNN